MLLIITILAVFAILVINELWWRLSKPNDEISRKAAHILIGSYVAFWPFYLKWSEIELLGLAFFIVILISKKLKVFKSIHNVDRSTWGELMFAVSVVLVALITKDKQIYMTAILTMALADGLAAILGTYFGKSLKYKIFGNTKSLVGSLSFYVVTLGLLGIYNLNTTSPKHGLVYLSIALGATVLENLSINGLDNLTVPLLIAICLK